MDQTQTSRYVLRFEPLLYVPAFTQKDFHNVHIGPSIKGRPLRNYNSTSGVHNSSLQNNHLYTRGKAQSQNNNHLYTRGIKAQSQTLPQSLHKRDKGTKPNHNLNRLYTRGTRHKVKVKKDYNSW